MKRSVYPYLLVFALLGLLGLLATLQYRWLGQISDAEKVRLEERLSGDTKRFTDDFNREIQKAYYSFQIDAEDFEEKNWNSFVKRFEFWKTRTEFPGLVKDVYFYKNGENPEVLKFDKSKNTFTETDFTDELKAIETRLKNDREFSPLLGKQTALAVPVYKKEEHLEKIVIQKRELHDKKLKTETAINLPEKYGFILIKLDENIIKTNILPGLVQKYFSDSDGINYKIAVKNPENQMVFQTHDEHITKADATAKFFNLVPNDMIFFSKEIGNAAIEADSKPRREVIYSRRNSVSTTKTTEVKEEKDEIVSVNVQRMDDAKQRIAVFEGKGQTNKGIWTLDIQHTSGSLEQFITNTRRRNLGISFGILSLLAVSVILIFLSSQRAKSLAQKQMDFVSSVSHEFRTPLAVIYSAGENLSDGVVGEKEMISHYGKLIKREGKKLSGMVEQILEFAGARSGKRKFDFRRVSVEKIISDALAECQPLIEEQGFEVEREVSGNLPQINADEKALTQAVQNLINNSLKYGNGTKWLKVSAFNGEGTVKISVEDQGIGISKKDKKQIFEPFFRAETVVDEQISGNGLGLSLVKQIVEAHGGKILVESEIGKGSKFIVHLPLNI